MDIRSSADIVRQRLSELCEASGPSRTPQRSSRDSASFLQAYEMFQFWSGHFGVFHASSDTRSFQHSLREAPAVARRINELLDELMQHLEDSTSGPDAYDLDATTEPSESDATVAELANLTTSRDCYDASVAAAILDTVNRLFKTSMLATKSHTRDRYLKAEAAKGPSFEERYDIMHVEEFARARGGEAIQQGWLLDRLGRANIKRREYLRYCRSHQEKISQVHDSSAPAREEDNAAQDGGNRASEAALTRTACSRPSHRMTTATTVVQHVPLIDDGFDDRDDSTVATTVNPERDAQPLKIPDMSEFGELGVPFECPYCRKPCQFNGQSGWRKHAKADLRPYVCTFENCGLMMFEDRQAWATHELKHRRVWFCQRCSANGFTDVPALRTHLEEQHGLTSSPETSETQLNICSVPADAIAARSCTLCSWDQDLRQRNAAIPEHEDVVVTSSRFMRHLANHLEQLAFFALPKNGFKEADSNAAAAQHADDTSSLSTASAVTSEPSISDYENDDARELERGTVNGVSKQDLENIAKVHVDNDFRTTAWLAEHDDATAFNVTDAKAVDRTLYEGYVLERLSPMPGETISWHKCGRRLLPYAQEELIRLVKKHRKAANILSAEVDFKRLSSDKQGIINRVIEEKKLFEKSKTAEWTLVDVQTVERRTGWAKEIVKLQIVIKRRDKGTPSRAHEIYKAEDVIDLSVPLTRPPPHAPNLAAGEQRTSFTRSQSAESPEPLLDPGLDVLNPGHAGVRTQAKEPTMAADMQASEESRSHTESSNDKYQEQEYTSGPSEPTKPGQEYHSQQGPTFQTSGDHDRDLNLAQAHPSLKRATPPLLSPIITQDLSPLSPPHTKPGDANGEYSATSSLMAEVPSPPHEADSENGQISPYLPYHVGMGGFGADDVPPITSLASLYELAMRDDGLAPGRASLPEPLMNDDHKYICNFGSDDCKHLVFDRKIEWSEHMDKHEKPYRCSEPGCATLQGFVYPIELLWHEREVHGKFAGPKAKLMCPYPDCKHHTRKAFVHKENLNEHIRRVHSRDAQPAEQPATSSSLTAVEEHEPPGRNSELGLSFDFDGYSTFRPTPIDTGPWSDISVLPPSTGELPSAALPVEGFKCDWPGCEAAPFATQYLLSSHRNVHITFRPLYCLVKGCPRSEGGRGFTSKDELLRHGLDHKNRCPFCPGRAHKYSRRDNLLRHVRVYHSEKDLDDPQLRAVLSE